MPVAGEQPHASGVTARHQPVAVVLDFLNPVRAGRRSVGRGWEAGFDEAERRQTATRQHGKNEIPCCMYVAERENGTPCKSWITLGTDLYRLRHGPTGPPRKKFHRAGIFERRQ